MIVKKCKECEYYTPELSDRFCPNDKTRLGNPSLK